MSDQNKRLFFTCQIEADYMAKYFGVKIEVEGDCVKEWAVRLKLPEYKYYVAKESESIFKPKEGDKMQIFLASKLRIYTFSNNGVSWLRAKIIMRKSKHFFMSEVETGLDMTKKEYKKALEGLVRKGRRVI